MRGTRQYSGFRFASLGIIPACAGNTRGGVLVLSEPRDHPRVCGEHHLIGVVDDATRGSSPRVRGTHDDGVMPTVAGGIIPACAGNTRVGQARRIYSRDHPRVCGEHRRRYADGASDLGSSPRVRGTRIPRAAENDIPGIIPACAGNTCNPFFQPFRSRDHPRVCGEHDDVNVFSVPQWGSSPRVRGTPVEQS